MHASRRRCCARARLKSKPPGFLTPARIRECVEKESEVMKSCLALFSGEPSRLSSVPARRRALTLTWLGALVCMLLACAAQAAPTCYRYGGAWENNIPNKLYL